MTPSLVRTRWRAVALNTLLFAASIAVVLIVAEHVFRYRYAHMLYNPRPVVAAVQQYLTLDRDIGFRWQPDISAERRISFNINDIQPRYLCTDAFGVINSPSAIELRRQGRPVDVIGVGDSFMEMAADIFHRRLLDDGRFYYSLAIHRQAPPQYSALLTSTGLSLRPAVVVYGLFENDFNETMDFRNWRRSGMDWFAYHSGVWCGPPVGETVPERLFQYHARGWRAFGRAVQEKFGGTVAASGPGDGEIRDVAGEIRAAADACRGAGARFVLMLIPSKETAMHAYTSEANAYDAVLRLLADLPIEVIDLRPLFRSAPDPKSLYYVEDGHWNDRGIELAATELLNILGARNEP